MNTRYDDDTDLNDLHEPQRDREISLGAATILGIFFVLALICAVFFGFGYTLGHRSSPQPASIPAEPSTTLSSTASKPSPGSAAIPPAPTKTASDASATSEADEPTKIAQLPIPTPATHTVALDATPTTPAPKPAVSHAAVLKPTPPPIPTVALSTPGAAIVQVAAVSHQEDADSLFTALKRRGYAVAIRHEPQDKLLHVQLGPFATKKDAEAMRQRLLSDGYNAIVK